VTIIRLIVGQQGVGDMVDICFRWFTAISKTRKCLPFPRSRYNHVTLRTSHYLVDCFPGLGEGEVAAAVNLNRSSFLGRHKTYRRAR
jgi:hypothetical protein